MILCHESTRRRIGDYRGRDARGLIPPLPALVELYERAAAWVRAARVIAVSLNTAGLDEQAARAVLAHAAQETGLPAADPVRFGPEPLVEAVLRGAGGER
jgi:uncharacterized NAD-dependent epimerase/dehydratase family protein